MNIPKDKRLKMRCFVLCCSIVLGVFPIDVVAADGDEKTQILARLRSELPEAHARWRERFANVKVTGNRRKEENSKEHTTDVTYYLKGEKKQCELRYIKKPSNRLSGDGRVFSIQEGAAFDLEYAAPSTYLIRRYSTEKDWLEQMDVTAHHVMNKFLYAPLQMSYYVVSALAADKSFTVTSVRKSTWQGREAIHVEAKWNNPADWEFKIESAGMTFVPSLDWAMVEWVTREGSFHQGKLTNRLVSSAKIDYGSVKDGEPNFPLSVQLTERSELPTGKLAALTKATVTFESFEPGVVTDEQFSPAAYGLPDYLHPRVAWYRRMWVWIVLLNVVAIAAVVWYLLRRRAMA